MSAHFRDAILSPEGDQINLPLVIDLLDPTTGLRISQTVYSDDALTQVLTLPFTTTASKVEFYLAQSQRVKIHVTYTTVYGTVTTDSINDVLDPNTSPGLANHLIAADPHSQYATDTDLTNHTSAANPHAIYSKLAGGTFTGTVRFKQGPDIDVRAYGAIGDGASHVISAGDITANPQWIGTYTAGTDEWDYVAIQEAIYAAFATNSTPGVVAWNGTANKQLNRPLRISAGLYYLNKALTTTYLVGGLVKGEGRLASRLMRVSPSGTAHLWTFNGVSHSTFRDFGMLGGGGAFGVNGSLMNIDWDGTAGGAGLHGNLFVNMAFDAQTNGPTIDWDVRVGFAQQQGDTHSFHSCLFQGAQRGAVYFGGFNALSQNFVNCDFIQQIADDIYINGGSLSTYGCQVEGTAWGSAAKTGYFINIQSGAGNHTQIISHTRCEIPKLANLVGDGAGVAVFEANSVAVGASRNDWVAATAYAFNDTVRANGSIYLCTVAGTSGGSTPAWAVGGATITDNTVTWVHQNFSVVNTSAHGIFTGNLLPWGQITGLTSGKLTTFINNVFTRTDWLSNTGDVYDIGLTSTTAVKAWNNRVTFTGVLNGAAQLYTSPGHGVNVDAIAAYSPMWLGTEPIIWQTGAGSSNASADVGLGRNDGTSLPNNVGAYNETRKSRNVLALMGPDASFGRLVPTTADTAGTDLRLQAGLGTGTQQSGGVSLRVGTAVGASSATPNDAGEMFRVDPGGVRFRDPALVSGQSLDFKALYELTTIAAAATSTTAIQIPANAVVYAVSVRVTTAIPTATSMQIGDGTTANKFNTGANIGVAAGTTDPGTKAGPTYYAAATPIVITPSVTPGNANGRVRVTIHYYQATPPTS